MDDAGLFTARRILVYVEDLEAATDYYSNVLGFVGVGGVPGVNREFSTSGPPLVLHEGGRAAREPRGRVGFVPSFQVEGGICQFDRYLQATGGFHCSRGAGGLARVDRLHRGPRGQRDPNLPGEG